MEHFCSETYLIVGRVLVWCVPAFMALALISAAAFAFAEIRARLKPADPAAQAAAAQETVGDLMKALTDLIAALGNAPIWLSMFALAVALYWFVGAGVASTCLPKPDPAPTVAVKPGTPK